LLLLFKTGLIQQQNILAGAIILIASEYFGSSGKSKSAID
jgi:hypothetical protein